MTAKETDKVAATVSRQILDSGFNADYENLLGMFSQVKFNITEKRSKTPKRYTPKSPTMRNLELRFTNAIASLQQEKSQLSLFAVENLEKLLSSQ